MDNSYEKTNENYVVNINEGKGVSGSMGTEEDEDEDDLLK